jgi:hypothetical protein
MAETAPSPLISAAGLAALLDQGTDIVLLDVGSGGQRLGIGGAYAVELETHFAGKGGGTRAPSPNWTCWRSMCARGACARTRM